MTTILLDKTAFEHLIYYVTHKINDYLTSVSRQEATEYIIHWINATIRYPPAIFQSDEYPFIAPKNPVFIVYPNTTHIVRAYFDKFSTHVRISYDRFPNNPIQYIEPTCKKFTLLYWLLTLENINNVVEWGKYPTIRSYYNTTYELYEIEEVSNFILTTHINSYTEYNRYYNKICLQLYFDNMTFNTLVESYDLNTYLELFMIDASGFYNNKVPVISNIVPSWFVKILFLRYLNNKPSEIYSEESIIAYTKYLSNLEPNTRVTTESLKPELLPLTFYRDSPDIYIVENKNTVQTTLNKIISKNTRVIVQNFITQLVRVTKFSIATPINSLEFDILPNLIQFPILEDANFTELFIRKIRQYKYKNVYPFSLFLCGMKKYTVEHVDFIAANIPSFLLIIYKRLQPNILKLHHLQKAANIYPLIINYKRILKYTTIPPEITTEEAHISLVTTIITTVPYIWYNKRTTQYFSFQFHKLIDEQDKNTLLHTIVNHNPPPPHKIGPSKFNLYDIPFILPENYETILQQDNESTKNLVQLINYNSDKLPFQIKQYLYNTHLPTMLKYSCSRYRCIWVIEFLPKIIDESQLIRLNTLYAENNILNNTMYNLVVGPWILELQLKSNESLKSYSYTSLIEEDIFQNELICSALPAKILEHIQTSKRLKEPLKILYHYENQYLFTNNGEIYYNKSYLRYNLVLNVTNRLFEHLLQLPFSYRETYLITQIPDKHMLFHYLTRAVELNYKAVFRAFTRNHTIWYRDYFIELCSWALEYLPELLSILEINKEFESQFENWLLTVDLAYYCKLELYISTKNSNLLKLRQRVLNNYLITDVVKIVISYCDL